MGFGHVLTVVAAITTTTAGLAEADQGVGGSLAQLPTFLGAIGVAGLAAVAAAGTGATRELATLAGGHAAFLVAGAVVLLAAVVAGTVARKAIR